MRHAERGLEGVADLLARPHSALLQCLSGLEFALTAVEGTKVPQGSIHCRAA